jgi:hypothetical protein
MTNTISKLEIIYPSVEQAQLERDRAETERVAKEQALDPIAKFAAKLREMGIDPENL